MRAKLIDEHDQRVFAVIFDTGEDPMEGLTRFAREQKKKDYERIPVREQTEVLALLGDIAVEGQDVKKVHAHVVLGKRDGAACGGHLLSAKVRPTLEVILTESPGHLKRRHDPRSGLSLIRIDA